MTTQRPWQSRTMWVNLVSSVVGFSTVFGLDLGFTPEQQLELVGGIMVVVNAINAYLRTVSTKAISLKASEDPVETEPPTGV